MAKQYVLIALALFNFSTSVFAGEISPSAAFIKTLLSLSPEQQIKTLETQMAYNQAEIEMEEDLENETSSAFTKHKFVLASLETLHVDVSIYKTPKGVMEFLVAKIGKEILFATVISTGLHGPTPANTANNPYFEIQERSKFARSRLFQNAPMPYAQFFNGHIGFHGISEDAYPFFGQPASHGCVRMPIHSAKEMWELVSNYGENNVRVKVLPSGVNPKDSEVEMALISKQVEKSKTQADKIYKAYEKTGKRDPDWPAGML